MMTTPATVDPATRGRRHVRSGLRRANTTSVVLAAALLFLASKRDVGRARGRAQAETRRADQLQRRCARMAQTDDRARRRLGRALHDGPQQRLTHLALLVSEVRNATEGASGTSAEEIGRVLSEAQATLTDLRRVVSTVHPVILSTRGLRSAVEAATSTMPVLVLIDIPDRRWHASVECVAYAVIVEGLSNAVRHAGASRVEVTAGDHERELRVTVSDDGRGGARAISAGGLEGMADRVAAGGGSLSITSRPGSGTVIVATFPPPI